MATEMVLGRDKKHQTQVVLNTNGRLRRTKCISEKVVTFGSGYMEVLVRQMESGWGNNARPYVEVAGNVISDIEKKTYGETVQVCPVYEENEGLIRDMLREEGYQGPVLFPEIYDL
ncbi:MAG: hypothetical protein ABIF40_01385 [archaeon]